MPHALDVKIFEVRCSYGAELEHQRREESRLSGLPEAFANSLAKYRAPTDFRAPGCFDPYRA